MTPHVVIITDHKWHNFMVRDDVPSGVLENQFSHLKGDKLCEEGFFKYHEWWYHLSDFSIINKDGPLSRNSWHGYLADSFYSGVLVQVHADHQQYKVGRYMA